MQAIFACSDPMSALGGDGNRKRAGATAGDKEGGCVGGNTLNLAGRASETNDEDEDEAEAGTRRSDVEAQGGRGETKEPPAGRMHERTESVEDLDR